MINIDLKLLVAKMAPTMRESLEGAAGLWTALLGLLAGFVLLLIPYLLGGMGAGDVKALAALGALLGAGIGAAIGADMDHGYPAAVPRETYRPCGCKACRSGHSYNY